MKIARIWLLVTLGMFLVSVHAQAQCNWDQTQSGKITETCGSVGIGTTAPAATLHVTSPTSDKVEIQLAAGPGAAPGTRLRFVGDRMWTLGTLEFNPGKFTLWDPNTSTYRMVFDPAAGAAFGTNTPWGGLHVFGTGQSATNPTLTSTSKSINGATLFLQDSLNAVGNGGMLALGAGAGHFAAIKGAIADGSNNTIGNMIFATRNQSTDDVLTERMRIMSDGHILMNRTDAPPATLAILHNTLAGGWALQAEHSSTLSSNGSSSGKGALIIAQQNVPAGVTNSGALEAMHVSAQNLGAGRINAMSGAAIYAGNNVNGTVDWAAAIYAQVINGTGGTITNGYGIYIQDSAATNGYGVFQTGGNDINYFAGRVGINTAAPNPAYMLDVAGNANFSGTVTGGNIQAKYQDVAEWVPTTETLSPGMVVVLDAANTNHVVASLHSYDTKVAGVISARPGLVLGEAGDAKALVATTGRVRVRVDATQQPVAIGDLLVSSEKPGMAMKSMPMDFGGASIHRPGTIIGKALEPLPQGEGEILVLLSLQ